MKRIVALSVALVLALPGPASFACGPLPLPGPGRPLFDWSMAADPYYISVISSEFLKDGSLSDYEAEGRIAAGFMVEWTAYLGLSPRGKPAEAVAAMLSSDDPEAEWKAGVAPLVAEPKRSSKEILRYLGLLAGSQRIDAALDPWSDADRPTKADYAKLAADAAAALDAGKDAFLRRRTALVLLKAEELAGEHAKAKATWAEWFAPAPDGILKARAAGWIARASLAQGKRVEAMATYVSLMDQYPDTAADQVASLLAVAPSEAEWDSLIASLPKGHRRAMVHLCRALLDPHRISTRYMEAMFAEEPGSAHLGKLLIRAMREVDWQELPLLYSRAGLGTQAFLPAAEDAIPAVKEAELLAFVEKALARGGLRDPGLFRAAAAHLRMLKGDFKGARALLDAAGPKDLARGPGAQLIAYHKWFLAAATGDKAREALWKPAMLALEARRSDGGDDSFTREGYAFLGEKCLEEGKVPEAIVAFGASGYAGVAAAAIDIYATIDELRALAALDPAKAGGELGALLAYFPADRDGLSYAVATRLLRERKFSEAAAAYAAIPAAFFEDISMRSYYTFFDEELPLGSLPVAEADTLAGDAPRAMVARKDLAARLAALERVGNWEAIGWIYLSSPYVAYDDYHWRGGMVWGAGDGALSDWPYVGEKSGALMKARKKAFLELYDTHAVGAEYLVRAMAQTADPERKARIAVAAFWGYGNPSYSESFGLPAPKKAKADALLALMRKELARTAYLSRYAAGCPALGDMR